MRDKCSRCSHASASQKAPDAAPDTAPSREIAGPGGLGWLGVAGTAPGSGIGLVFPRGDDEEEEEEEEGKKKRKKSLAHLGRPSQKIAGWEAAAASRGKAALARINQAVPVITRCPKYPWNCQGEINGE